jgi:diguanylate cyclase (GGDEF)-like protein
MDNLIEEREKLLSRIRELEAIAEEKEHSEKIHRALLRIASLSSEARELIDFYTELHQIIGQLMYANNFYIALLTDDKSHIKFEYFHDEVDPINPVDWAPEPLASFNATLTGYLLRTGEALLVDKQELERLVLAGEVQYRGQTMSYWMGVPLKVHNETIGVLVIQSYSDDIEYSIADKELLIFVSQQVAVVLQKKRYEQRLKEYNEQLERKVEQRTAMLQKINQDLEQQIRETEQAEKLQRALFKISELTNTTADLDEFYLSLHKIINGIMPSKNFYVCTYDDETHVIDFPYVIDEFDSNADSRSLDTNKSLDRCSPTEWVLRTGKPLLINKSNLEHWVHKNVILGTPPETWLGVPLFKKDHKVCGVLVVQSYLKGKSYSKLDEEILVFVAQQVSTTLARKRSAESLKQAHEELKAINDQLERRVEERTQELSITNKTLQSMLDERNRMQKKLAFEAFHDSLTGLPNRALFTNRLEQILRQRQRNPEVNYSVLFLDLDRFKVINDSLGHLMGDKLLQEVAARLEDCVRPKDTVARLGGDEFCVLLKDIGNERDAAVIASRIIDAIAQPFVLNEQKVFTSTSIGITISNDSYQSPEDVLRDADAAMYHAKEAGKARYTLFDKDMHDAAMKRLTIENELRHALERNQIKVFYQPIVNLDSGRIVAFEALARWQHDELGMISPLDFIPIAEETGMIRDIGLFILNHSLFTLKQWHLDLPQAAHVAMSVNFSSKQIEHHDLLSEIKQALEENQIEPKYLKVEITESLLIENAALAQQLLDGLSAIHVPVLLDDFGTGYSSLSYLHKFTLDTIKIDRSFIDPMDHSDKHLTIVKTIAYMSSQLNLGLIAEGVESQRHVDILKELNVKHAQGYFYSKPVDAEHARELLLKFN